METKQDTAVEKGEKIYIIPPELFPKVISYLAHYQVSKQGPIMIVGNTGVGKSLFLRISEKLWLEKNKGTKVVWENCAHFGAATGDINIARSELFGLRARSISIGLKDSDSEKHDVKGLVKEADGGLLILEEVGELHPVIQAMLLTFVETGKYRRLGDTEKKNSSARIIGATNRESNLRDDFRYRFFPFYVPPVYQRRRDILYYICNFDPELLKTLTTWEVLVLLAYNWPGNVREIERVCRLLKRRRTIPKILKGADGIEGELTSDPDRLQRIERIDTALDASSALALHKGMKEKGIDVDALEKILNRFGIGLSPSGKTRPFKNLATPTPTFDPDFDKRFGVQTLKCPAFDEAYEGLLLFSSLFFQDPDDNKNILDTTKGSTIEFYYPLGKLSEREQGACGKLMVSVFDYLTKHKLPRSSEIPEDYKERITHFSALHSSYPHNVFLSSILGKKPERVPSAAKGPDIYSMSYEDFMKHYYTEHLKRADFNYNKISQLLNVNYQTLVSRLKKHSVV